MKSLWIRWGLLAITALSIGCGTMVVATNHPDAQIYVDGKLVGHGEAEVSAMGPPGSAVVKVIHGDQMIERNVHRSFTITTLLSGVFSYGTGFIWGWEYPEEVLIRLDRQKNIGWSTTQMSEDDPWSKPMYAPSSEDKTSERKQDGVSAWGPARTQKSTPRLDVPKI